MADTKISALTAVSAAADTDQVPVNQGGTTKRETLAQIRTQLDAGVSGGRTISGGTASGDDLTVQSTSHATKGYLTLEGTLKLSQRLVSSFPATIVEGDTVLLVDASAGTGQTYALNLPTIAAANRGAVFIVARIDGDGTNVVRVTAGGSDTIEGGSFTDLAAISTGTNQACILISPPSGAAWAFLPCPSFA